jgi:glycosyltransferase involved in cell wall biosynthesis
MSVNKPTTALLIPCYNAERYLPNLRKQVDALDPAFDELVMVDDGSADGTVARAQDLGFAIVPLGTNRGPGAARNAAAKRATAEWIHFLDADDEIAPDYLAKVLLIAGDDTDVVLSSTQFVDEETHEPTVLWEYSEAAFRENALRAAIVHPVLLHSSLIRRRCFETIRGFDEEHRCWEDGDLHVRLAASGAQFQTTSALLAWSPRHKRGTSGSDLYCHRCRLEFLEKYEDYVPRVSREDVMKEAIFAATLLAKEGDSQTLDRALDLAIRLGWRGPESGHPLLAFLAKLPSARLRKILFSAQMRARGGGAALVGKK